LSKNGGNPGHLLPVLQVETEATDLETEATDLVPEVTDLSSPATAAAAVLVVRFRLLAEGLFDKPGVFLPVFLLIL